MIEKYTPQELTISDAALDRIGKLVSDEAGQKVSLRVFVTGGGCSGFQYGFKLEDHFEDDDTFLKREEFSVVIDPLSMQYIFGSTLDYKEDLEGSRFVIDNPNAVTTCGCGSSFSI